VKSESLVRERVDTCMGNHMHSKSSIRVFLKFTLNARIFYTQYMNVQKNINTAHGYRKYVREPRAGQPENKS